MSSDKKISTPRAIINAVLLVLIGAIIAAIFLILTPPKRIAELPDNPRNGAVYYAAGKAYRGALGTWANKRAKMNSGKPYDIFLTEEELNAWMASGFAAETPSAFSLVPEPPNFYIGKNTLQIAIPFKLVLLGKTFPVVLQARGKIVRDGGGFVYKPAEIYAGSLPLHRIGLGDLAFNRAAALLERPDDLAKAWRKLSVAEINGKVLHLVSP